MQTQPGGPAPETVLGIAAWARHALARLAGISGVRRVGLGLVEGGGRRLRFTASDRDHEGTLHWCHVDAYDDVPLNTAVRTGAPVVGAFDDLSGRYPAFVERQGGTTTVALAAVPMVAAGQTLGGYVLFFDRPQAFDQDQRRDLVGLGEDLAGSLRRAQRAADAPKVALSEEPVPPGALVAHHVVTPVPSSVADARRFLRRTLGDWGFDPETADTAVLCLSELVTNAVIHAGTGCVVRVLLDRGVLTTTVRDSGTRDAASAEPVEDALQVHGRGLQLIDTLATRWGSEVDTVGTTVWFALDR